MSETKSLYQRLVERRAALDAGDPTGASAAANAAPVRAATAPAPAVAPAGAQGGKSKAAAGVTRRANESASSFRLRQIDAAKAAGEL